MAQTVGNPKVKVLHFSLLVPILFLVISLIAINDCGQSTDGSQSLVPLGN